jgi:hypothetical protein
MMATFTPPTDDFYNLSDFDVDKPWTAERRRAYMFLRHYAALPRGRNVYKLTDGTYIENDPADISDVAITYYGGHQYTVDDTEAAALTAAGYGDYIT